MSQDDPGDGDADEAVGHVEDGPVEAPGADVEVEEIDHVAEADPVEEIAERPAAEEAADKVRLPVRPVDAACVIKGGEGERGDEQADEQALALEHPEGDPLILGHR